MLVGSSNQGVEIITGKNQTRKVGCVWMDRQKTPLKKARKVSGLVIRAKNGSRTPWPAAPTAGSRGTLFLSPETERGFLALCRLSCLSSARHVFLRGEIYIPCSRGTGKSVEIHSQKMNPEKADRYIRYVHIIRVDGYRTHTDRERQIERQIIRRERAIDRDAQEARDRSSSDPGGWNTYLPYVRSIAYHSNPRSLSQLTSFWPHAGLVDASQSRPLSLSLSCCVVRWSAGLPPCQHEKKSFAHSCSSSSSGHTHTKVFLRAVVSCHQR